MNKLNKRYDFGTKTVSAKKILEKAGEILEELYKYQPVTSFTSVESVQYFLQIELSEEEREHFMVLFLDNQHRLLKKEVVFSGTINCATVHPREIIKSALACNASAMILAHNHPSGVSDPSLADREITKEIQKAAELMEIRVLDHFVIGKGNYFSFAESGWL